MAGKSEHRGQSARSWTNTVRVWLGVAAVLGLVLQLTLAGAHTHIGRDHLSHSQAADPHAGHGHDDDYEAHGNAAAHPFHASTTACQDGHEPSDGQTGETDACLLCLALWHANACLAPVAPPFCAPERLAQAQILAFETAVFARQDTSAHGTRAPPAA